MSIRERAGAAAAAAELGGVNYHNAPAHTPIATPTQAGQLAGKVRKAAAAPANAGGRP
jgi:hypothetical protein